MAINQESFNSGLYDLLKTRGYNPTPIDSKGQNTPVPQDADVFKFDFKKSNGKEDFGPVWATIDNAAKLIIYYDDDIADSGYNNTSGTGFSDSWPSLLKVLKRWAMRKQLGFELKNRDHLGSDMAQREHVKKKEALGESYHSMGNTTSYNDAVPQVKIIIQHTRKIEEGEKRFHNIERIFVENTNGEKFAIPTKRPGIAKVYARHVAEGGSPYDERGKHITSLVEEYTKMAGFVRATKNGTFNESAQQLINEGLNHYQSLRETLSRMIGNRGYNTYFESWTPTLMETEGDEMNLNELFVKETLDPRIESVMPILKRLSKNIGEMKEVSALAEWANNITEEESLKSNNPIGIPEGESKERPYICVHVKKGKCEVKANSSYEAAQKAAQHWKLKSTAGIDAHLADVTHDPASLNEVTRLSSAQDAGNVFELYKEYLDSFDFEEDNIDKSNSNWEDYFISGALNFLHKKGIPVRFRKTIVKDMLNMFDPNATKELPFSEATDLNTITEPTADDEEKRKQSAENIKKMLQRAIEFMNQLRTRSVTPKEEKQLQEVANLFGTIAEDPILQLALHKIGVSEKDLNDVVEKAMLLIGEPDSEYVHENGEIEENFINMVPQAVAEGAMSDLDADRKKGTQDYHARKKLEDYIRTKERVIAGGNALSPGERRSLAQARKELKALTSKNQGVAETYQFKKDSPLDVDMHYFGDTDNVETNKKAEWEFAVNRINARVFDDNAEFSSDIDGEEVRSNGVVWAEWDNKSQIGWYNIKGRPLKTYPMTEQGVEEGSLNEGQYEMMMRNGQVKKFIAKDDADAKRIAAGHNAKSVIKLRGGVPAGKVSEQGVAEGAPELLQKEMPLYRHAEKLLAQNGVSKDDPDYHHHLNNTIKHLRQFGNIDLINKSDKQGVAEGYTPSAGELARDLIRLTDSVFFKKYGRSKKQAKQHYTSSNLKEQGMAEGSHNNIMTAWNSGMADDEIVKQFGQSAYDSLIRKYGSKSIPVPTLHGYRPTEPTDPSVRIHRGLDGPGKQLKSLIAQGKQGVAEGSGGNWYIRVNGKILNDTKFKPVIFSSKDEARSHAMKLADKKRIPLSQIKLTKSWMDAPEPGVAEGLDANQKRAGQLGPTEKVGKNEKNLRGRLVGNESVDPEIIRIRKLSGI